MFSIHLLWEYLSLLFFYISNYFSPPPVLLFFFILIRPPPRSPLFPNPTLSRSQVAPHSAAAITREILPDGLLAITFDSAPRFNMQLNYDPLNRFRLVLDFREPGGVISYDPWNSPTPNESSFTIIGNNQTWVAGVSDMALGFLKDRKRSRRWLHGPITFTLVNWLVG